jgi:hypothetical protein
VPEALEVVVAALVPAVPLPLPLAEADDDVMAPLVAVVATAAVASAVAAATATEIGEMASAAAALIGAGGALVGSAGGAAPAVVTVPAGAEPAATAVADAEGSVSLEAGRVVVVDTGSSDLSSNSKRFTADAGRPALLRAAGDDDPCAAEVMALGESGPLLSSSWAPVSLHSARLAAPVPPHGN